MRPGWQDLWAWAFAAEWNTGRGYDSAVRWAWRVVLHYQEYGPYLGEWCGREAAGKGVAGA